MNSLSDFFTGNPFSTPTGQLIEKATDSNQVADNWALNISICDHINSCEDGPKDAIRAIRRRFNNAIASKNSVTTMYTLTVLETCVKNCGYRFHLALANREFLIDFTKVVGPRTETPSALQEKILSLIQSWMDAFRGQPDLKEVGRIYEELRERGVDFPATDVDNMVPINTPKSLQDMPDNDPAVKYHKKKFPFKSHSSKPKGATQTAGIVKPSHEHAPKPTQLSGLPKLRRDLEMVQANVRIFNELLNEFPPNADIPKDAMQLILDLEFTCGQMQTRMVALLGSLESDVANSPGLGSQDTLMAELLKVNDELNNVFVRYQRFQRYREGGKQPADSNCANSDVTAPAPSYPQAKVKSDLIDFSAQNQNGATGGSSVAQAYANQTDCSNFAPGLNSHRLKREEESPFLEGIPDTKEDLDEMEKWVEQHEAELMALDVRAPTTGAQQNALTSSEFDQFLSDRTTHNLGINGDSSVNRRQMKKDDKEDAMFAL